MPLSRAYRLMSAIKGAPPKTAPHGPPNMAPRANVQRAATALILKTEPNDAHARTPEGRPFPVPPEIFRGGGRQRLKRLKMLKRLSPLPTSTTSSRSLFVGSAAFP